MDDASTLLLVALAVLGVVLVVLLVLAIRLFVRLIRLHAVVTDPRMPTEGKIAFWVAAVYAVFPVDVLPDPIYLDDLGVLAGAVVIITNLARRRGILRRDPASGREVRDVPQLRARPVSEPDPRRGRR